MAAGEHIDDIELFVPESCLIVQVRWAIAQVLRGGTTLDTLPGDWPRWGLVLKGKVDLGVYPAYLLDICSLSDHGIEVWFA